MMGPAASRGRAGRLTAIGVALVIIVSLSGCATPKPQAPIGGAMRAATARTDPVARSPHTRTAKAQGNIQMSGAAGDGIANGDFGRWRGTPVTIGGAWDDMPDDQTRRLKPTLTKSVLWRVYRRQLHTIGFLLSCREKPAA